MGNLLIILGIFLVVLGVAISSGLKFRLPLLPGDILIHKDNFTFYFPLVSSIVLSIILSFIFKIFKK